MMRVTFWTFSSFSHAALVMVSSAMMSSFSLPMCSVMILSALLFCTCYVSPKELADDVMDRKEIVEEGVVVVAVETSAKVKAFMPEGDIADVDGAAGANAAVALLITSVDGSGSSPDIVPQTCSHCSLARIRIFHIG